MIPPITSAVAIRVMMRTALRFDLGRFGGSEVRRSRAVPVLPAWLGVSTRSVSGPFPAFARASDVSSRSDRIRTEVSPFGI